MWSVVQHRPISKQVEQEWQNSKKTHRGNGNDFGGIEVTVPSSLAPPFYDETGRPEQDDFEGGRFFVDTMGDDDPIDPHNWTLTARCKNIAILSLLIFVQAWVGAAD